jgi:hypothetical protein
LAAALDWRSLDAFAPAPSALAPGLSRWDRIQHGPSLASNQSDCNWFAFETRDAQDPAGSAAGLIALHRTGARLARIAFPPALDRRPLFLAALYERRGDDGGWAARETAVEGELDPERFSFVSRDGSWQLRQGLASEWRPHLPPLLANFFAADTPAFAVRSANDAFELELFMRPQKDPVVYGDPETALLQPGRTAIHYVQRPRLHVIGYLRRHTRSGWSSPRILVGSATQDRHWMTVKQFGLRWTWFMARLEDGRECMAYQLRGADGGRASPTNAGEVAGGGAWIVGAGGEVQRARRFAFEVDPSRDLVTSRGRVPGRLRVELPDEGVRLVVEPRAPRFVPTKALGELVDAGIWESPGRLVEGTSGGEFWIDYMPPYGGV